MKATNQAEAIIQQLRKLILDVKLPPGERLSERQLETQTSASRTPVREALMKLEMEGLVRREKRGWMVTPIDIQEIHQLMDYREILEISAIQLIPDEPDAEILRRLAHNAVSRDTYLSKEELHASGTQFHLDIVRLANNPFLTNALSDALARLSRVRWLETEPQNQGWKDHQQIIQALSDGDRNQATTFLRAHLREHHSQLLMLLRDDNERQFGDRRLLYINNKL
ncbi:GntR family transcriptional regulator [Cedecea lapagei]|uniref:GntR family transcriptional regulator n=1 Tax=Cedecea lapagei TaxID=158823 RepID=UPI001BCBF400|nr:GntR family transcriptional regulator [Cedecea lapagei]